MNASLALRQAGLAGSVVAALTVAPSQEAVAQVSSALDASLSNTILPTSSSNASGPAALVLAAITSGGFVRKTFNSATNQWGPWAFTPYPARAFPSSYDRITPDRGQFPAVSWFDASNGTYRINAFYTVPGSLGAPWWTRGGTGFILDAHSPPSTLDGNNFAPATGFDQRDAALATYLRFFGLTNGSACGGSGLREYLWNPHAGAWQWADHGCEGGRRMDLGLGSSVHRPYGLRNRSTSFVFTVAHGTAAASHSVVLRWRQSVGASVGPWAWLDLGTPNGASLSLSGPRPVAVTYDRGNDSWRTHVFVTARATADGRFRLFEKYYDEATGWSSWVDHGRPILTAADSPDASATFQMTSALVTGRNQSLRIVLQGYSWSASGLQSGQFVEHLWDGTRWAWSPVERSGEFDAFGRPVPLRVKSSASIGDRFVSASVSSSGRLWLRTRDSRGAILWEEPR